MHLLGLTAIRKASRVAINKKDMELHAWIRRAASKVTIAYDATGLKEGSFYLFEIGSDKGYSC